MRKSKMQDILRDQEINLVVKVPEVSRQFKFNFSGNTIIKELCNRICDLLDLDPIKTNITLIQQFEVEQLNHSKTLLQNKLKNNAVILAKIQYTSSGSNLSAVSNTFSKSYGKEFFSKSSKVSGYSMKTKTEFCGLKIVGICINPTCIAYNTEVTVPMGFKTFDVNKILKKTKCQNCPYKDFDMQKPIIVKNFILTNCFWRLEGHFYDASGFYNYCFMKNWIKTEGCNKMIFFEKLNEKKYIDPQLILKPL